MNGFEIFIYIGVGAFIFIMLAAWILRKNFPSKNYEVTFGFSILALSVLTVIYSMYAIRGWDGMGVAFIGIFVAIGTSLGMVINMIIRGFSTRKKDTHHY
ncbi:YesK-like family protein [Ectobacillus panaciterrae]|uniref:YesK-like family protein n=1 Tax=Ectobacillus panaciterrae TaxID=363872 RepID=UPI000415A485|nr:YesK-like family protein [Ectobacillus panaciterrae]